LATSGPKSPESVWNEAVTLFSKDSMLVWVSVALYSYCILIFHQFVSHSNTC